ncbi:MAG: flavin reductase family protein [Bacteroidetes bacterium]|nr:flavin reductase family protein [Bacteroidota bacterium]
MPLTPLSPFLLEENIFRLLDKDWMLITAGEPGDFNTMTASWGGFGILWNKPVAYVVVRPTRYTYLFMERSALFTLSFLTAKYRKALNICGTLSGRDVDKVGKAGLTPFTLESGVTGFTEARMIMECKKLYYQDIDPDRFIDKKLDSNYPLADYHRMYIGEILTVFKND